MNAISTWRVGMIWLASFLMGMLPTSCGCTAESVRVALDSQRRADDVDRAVFERQHEGLRTLLFRDMLRRLDGGGVALTDEQISELNTIWNERDRLEFWAVQYERAKALRLVGVDAKLFADQSVLDLLIKQLEARIDRLTDGIASAAGAQAFDSEPRPIEPGDASQANGANE